MNLYAIRRRDFWGTPEELQATAEKSAQVGEEMSDDDAHQTVDHGAYDAMDS